ncbi:MAG: type II toxin-antitoxin system prevent-host-death family antitoxin [Thermomicrobiales bacterium]
MVRKSVPVREVLTFMPKTVTASEAKTQLGSLISWVRRDDESVIVENRGAPAAAIISIAEYERLQELKEKARREEALATLRRVRATVLERTKDLSADEREALIEEIADDAMSAVVAKVSMASEE